jgi:hypothetical protein
LVVIQSMRLANLEFATSVYDQSSEKSETDSERVGEMDLSRSFQSSSAA